MQVDAVADLDLPQWQRGYSLALLQSYAAVFAERHKPLVFGAFGLTKERDVAAALAEDGLICARNRSGAPMACAIAKLLHSEGHFADFAGREIEIPAGHVRVYAFACIEAAAGVALLASILSEAGAPVWIEAFEEDQTAREALDRCGLRYIATRIAAGSEIKGLYTNAALDLPALHLAEQAAVLQIAPGFASPEECTAVLAEADQYAKWAQHYSTYNRRQSWTAYALRGYDAGDPAFIIKPAEMAKAWKAANPDRMRARCDWTSAKPRFPAAVALAERILAGRPCERIRLMRLAPGGELSRHADVVNRDAGLADGLMCRLHLPLRTSPAVSIEGWDKRGRHVETRFPAGALCYLDQRGPHRVVNRDPALDRVHLVMDVHSDLLLRDQIASAMRTAPAP